MKTLRPVDGSESALDAVHHALHLLREGLRASFVLAAVQEATYAFEVMLAPDADVFERVTGAVGARALKSACERLSGSAVFWLSGRGSSVWALRIAQPCVLGRPAGRPGTQQAQAGVE